MKKLYLFTARYPYVGAESFLEEEILYLSKKFDTIYIIPFKVTNKGLRSLPDNCELLMPVVRGEGNFILKGLFCPRTIILLLKEFLVCHVFLNVKRLKVWLTAYSIVNNYFNTNLIKKIESELTATDVCYFYWGKWANVLSIYWKGKAQLVSRFHGQWDLWEDEYDNYAPLRKQISSSLNAAVFISQKGETFFKEHYTQCPTKVFRLGTKDVGISKRSEDGVVRILSCSTIYPLKRVDLILQSVKVLSDHFKVEWTHLGGGDDFEKIKALAEEVKDDKLIIHLLGQMSHDNILKYYMDNKVDLFVNLSTNEGIPVSIMEAISCDVPIVATNVGSTAEIVTEDTGMLVSPNPQPEEVARAMENVVNGRDQYKPRAFWKENYMAEKNYTDFADFLNSI